MLTLQQILESDSISSLVVKLNTNFQAIALSGGGPAGIPGEQGIPGLPGRQGALGPTGSQGPTGTVVGIIPFGSTAGGNTGPTGEAGPWNTYSYEYLTEVVGTGTNKAGQIWIDHWNRGFWKYLNVPDSTNIYTNSPYANPVTGTVPPGGTGYYGGTGWYFYPLNVQSSGGASDVWTSDVSTYLIGGASGGAWENGPYGSPSPLTVKNARLLSKYGTVWISSGNAIDSSGNDDQSNLNTDTIYSQGLNLPATLPQPARYNSGVDRIFFKQSIDTLPFTSNVTARAWTNPSGGLGNPGEESTLYPEQGGTLLDSFYWIKPYYSPSLNQYSPLQYYTERRDDTANYLEDTVFGSLGLYQYSSYPTYFTNTKSLFVYSTRSAITPESNTTPDVINNSNTFNIGEMVLDVKRLIASNQFICSTPQDLYGSSDFIQSGLYNEAIGITPYTVTQGFLSSINGKQLTGDPITTDILDYGNLTAAPATGTTASGNYTRSIWYGSAATVDPAAWYIQYDSEDAALTGSDTLPNFVDKTYRIAGMKERGKKTWNSSDDTYFLSELVFYSSQFILNNANHEADSTLVGFDNNDHNSRPGFYLSPYRNFGIGTFASDDSGVLEPAARLHVNTFIRNNDYSGITGVLNPNLTGHTGNYASLPSSTWKVGAFTAESSNFGLTATSIDLYIGGSKTVAHEIANPALGTGGTPYTPSENNLDVAIRRETWSPASNYFSTILRLGVKPKTTSTGSTSTVGLNASLVPTEFPFSMVPLVSATGATQNLNNTPVGVGIHNIFPRSRAHFHGKNLLNEAFTGNEPFSPGSSRVAGQSPTGTYPFYTPALLSNNQVVIDYIGSGYGYPAGINEYPYEAFQVPSGTANPDAVGGFSPNAANFPWRERVAPTRTVTPWGLTGRNYAYPSATGSVNNAYRHGGTGGNEGNIFSANQYVGFNLFRDLLNTGDNADTTRWRLGSNGVGYGNGGAAIIASDEGDLAFINIPQGRDGGVYYREWEQQGLSTRDVLNNISLIISKKGDIGIGNRGGYDRNAYSSLERNLASGYINIVPTTGDARVLAPTYGTSGSYIGNLRYPYGLVSYAGISATYSETTGTSNAAFINTNATQPEYIRFEVAAEKFYGKNSRSSLRAGYGYPPNISKTITTNLTDYLILDPSYVTANLVSIVINTDFEGRITSIIINGASGFVALTSANCTAFLLPHPAEFNSNSGTPWATAGFTAPPGAVAAELNPVINGWAATNVGNAFTISDTSFVSEEIGTANLRLNNFVAGEGMNVSTAAGQTAAAASVKTARQTSPKLILSFLEADNTTIPGTKATQVSQTIGQNRTVSGSLAYRKVNTIIGSKQNESSAREYWIPKSDNSGGTFVVFTDHYGNKTDSLDQTTVQTSRFYVEEVVTLEFVPGYTGTTSSTGTAITSQLTRTSNQMGGATGVIDGQFNQPLYVKYYNSQINQPNLGLTGPSTSNAFLASQYGRIVRPLSTIGAGAVTGTTSISFLSRDSVADIITTPFAPETLDFPGASILRNVDKYYNVWSDTGNWENGWGAPGEINNQSSAFRFKRINQDMALVDFNITIETHNPNLDTGAESTAAAASVIDGWSPRWTQYVRLAYLPTKGVSDDSNFFMKQFGNSLSFMNWSAFNQWYPGTAVVSDPAINSVPLGEATATGNPSGGDALTRTGLSQYTLPFAYGNHSQNITWNGNFIDAVVSRAEVSPPGYYINGNYSQIYAKGDPVPGTWPGENVGANDIRVNATGPFAQTDLVPRHAFAFYNSSISASLINGFSNQAPNPSTTFSFYMGRAYSILGNDYLSRQRSCMWRIVPRFGSHFGTTLFFNPGDVYKNNSFTLEVQFDKPILHISTPFADRNFRVLPSGATVKPYKYLTVNGQAMLRYSDKTQSTVPLAASIGVGGGGGGTSG